MTSIAVELSNSMSRATRREKFSLSFSSRSRALLVDPRLDRRRRLAERQHLPGEALGGVGERSRSPAPTLPESSAICRSTVSLTARSSASRLASPSAAALAGMAAEIASRARSEAWPAASRTRSRASISSGPVSAAIFCAAACASSAAAPSARNCSSALAEPSPTGRAGPRSPRAGGRPPPRSRRAAPPRPRPISRPRRRAERSPPPRRGCGRPAPRRRLRAAGSSLAELARKAGQGVAEARRPARSGSLACCWPAPSSWSSAPRAVRDRGDRLAEPLAMGAAAPAELVEPAVELGQLLAEAGDEGVAGRVLGGDMAGQAPRSCR